MNIFYNKHTLKDTLVGIVTTQAKVIKKEIGTDIAFFDEITNELVGFNIFNISKELKIAPGRVFITDQIRELISKRLNVIFKDVSNEFIVGKIIECVSLEDTHLFRCRLDLGNDDILDIVSGAQNVAKDLLVVVAKVGAMMPSGLVIKPSVLRGYQSNGMLCSQRELNLSSFNPVGIIELNSKKYAIGDLFKNAYNILSKTKK